MPISRMVLRSSVQSAALRTQTPSWRRSSTNGPSISAGRALRDCSTACVGPSGKTKKYRGPLRRCAGTRSPFPSLIYKAGSCGVPVRSFRVAPTISSGSSPCCKTLPDRLDIRAASSTALQHPWTRWRRPWRQHAWSRHSQVHPPHRKERGHRCRDSFPWSSLQPSRPDDSRIQYDTPCSGSTWFHGRCWRC